MGGGCYASFSGGAGSLSNTVWPGPRPTSVPSGILIHPTVWPHYAKTDRQRSDSIVQTIFGRPFVKRFTLCYRTVVKGTYAIGLLSCLSVLSCLSIMLLYCCQTVGWNKMKLGMQVGLGPGHIVLDGDRAPPPKGHSPQFSAHICCVQMAGWIMMPLGM